MIKERKEVVMKNRLMNVCMLAILLVGILYVHPKDVHAAMADEAENYELQTTFIGHIDGYEGRYYSFTINEKSYVSIHTSCSILSGTNKLTFQIYSGGSGAVVLRRNDIIESYNEATGTYVGGNGRILPSGSYYLFVYSGDDDWNWYTNANFSFEIQAEPLITLSKGKISSLSSPSKKKVKIACEADPKALGYRIQYSKDVRFKTGVKTVYTESNTKTISGLTAGSVYYVKVCPYSVYDDGSYVYGQNSTVKKIKIKK